MPEQLVFALATPGPPTFANFVTGANAEVVAVLDAVAQGKARDSVVLWGAAGAGKSHLLRATVAATIAAGRRSRYCALPADAGVDQDWAAGVNDDWALVAIDAIDTADAAAQARLFTLYNGLRDRGAVFLAAAAVPPSRSLLRDDLRTRLGWGLALEVHALADQDKPAALSSYARDRGLHLPDDVIAYLLTHARRDMPALVATLAALDRYSLARKRPVTLPLLRDWVMSTRAPGPPL